jgi:adenylate cyclase
MVLGDMGSRGARRKVNYTAIGEPVNLASRLEDANKCYSTEILIGEGTREAAADSIEVREIDLIRVKNRLHPVRIFELLAVKGSLSADQAMLAERFDEALAAYRRRDFRSALASFETLAAKFPLDGPTAVYLERCRAYSLLPPPEGWDGVWRASRG